MKIKNLTKKFNDKVVFDNYSVEFKKGKISYIMGESGIGKTTLLRIISGLDKDYDGEVSYEGKLAYVFQEPRLFPTVSVLKNLQIVNDSPTISANDLLEAVELSGCESLLPHELSGGMKMRLAIARAIYYNPDVILMDEPFSSIDADMRERIADKLFKFLSDKTVIIVSHDKNDAQRYADEIIEITN